MNRVVVATDGSALRNPHGPAGWAWFVSQDCWAAGGFTQASNQAAELFAVLAALRAVPATHPLLVRSDSQYTINAVSKWMPGRARNQWRRQDGQPVANRELLQDIARALQGRQVSFEWVKGHSGDAMNEIADRLCGAAAAAIAASQPVVAGPGWTGYQAVPVIPRVAAKQTARRASPQGRPGGAAGGRRGGRVGLDGVAVGSQSRTRRGGTGSASPTRAELQAEGWGANAVVKRVTSTLPSSPSRGRPEVCPSCTRAINPLTLHCGCGSL